MIGIFYRSKTKMPYSYSRELCLIVEKKLTTWQPSFITLVRACFRPVATHEISMGESFVLRERVREPSNRDYGFDRDNRDVPSLKRNVLTWQVVERSS